MLGQGIHFVDMANYFKGVVLMAVLFGQMYLQLKAPISRGINCILFARYSQGLLSKGIGWARYLKGKLD